MTVTCNDPRHEARRRIRNLDAVRTGAMVHDAGSDAELRRLGLIRVNSAGWYDLTPLGRRTLADLTHGTPCLICGAPINSAGEGHDPDCMGLDS